MASPPPTRLRNLYTETQVYTLLFHITFFTFGGNGTEIDVFEQGTSSPGIVAETIHRQVNAVEIGQRQAKIQTNMNLSSGFHVYRTDWDPWHIVFYIDNIQVWEIWRMVDAVSGNLIQNCTVGPVQYFDEPLFPQGTPNNIYLISDCKVAGFMNNGQFPTAYSDQMEVDYIRVYQRTPQAGLVDLCTTATVSGANYICNTTTPVPYTFNGSTSVVPVWSCSSNLTIVSTSGMTVNVQANSLVPGPAWVKANFANPDPCSQTEFTYNLWVGAPNSLVFATAPAYPLCYGNATSCSVTPSPGASTYNWSYKATSSPPPTFGLNLTPEGPICQIESGDVGTYQLSVSATNQCGTSASSHVSVAVANSTNRLCAGVTKRFIHKEPKDQPEPEIPIVFPNPANDQINIAINLEKGPYTISMYNVTGELMKTEIQYTDQQINLDIHSVPNGIYFLRIDNGTTIYQNKIVINHQ